MVTYNVYDYAQHLQNYLNFNDVINFHLEQRCIYVISRFYLAMFFVPFFDEVCQKKQSMVISG